MPKVIEKALSVSSADAGGPGVRSNATLAPSAGATRRAVVAASRAFTIGYLVMGADEVKSPITKGRKLPGKMAGFDRRPGWAWCVFAGAEGRASRSRLAMPGRSRRRMQCSPVITATSHRFSSPRAASSGGWEYLLDRAIFTFPPIADWGGRR